MSCGALQSSPLSILMGLHPHSRFSQREKKGIKKDEILPLILHMLPSLPKQSPAAFPLLSFMIAFFISSISGAPKLMDKSSFVGIMSAVCFGASLSRTRESDVLSCLLVML